MNILIVGGLGYIGGRLATYFQSQRGGHRIILTSTRPRYPSWAENFRVLPMDLREEDSIKRCLKESLADTIIHLGAISQALCQKDPRMAQEINVNGTARLFKAAAEFSIKQFVYFSTFQVYGKTRGMIDEKINPVPKNEYARTKYEAEKKIDEYSKDGRIKTLILRLSNVYGYPMDQDVDKAVWGLVFNSFCRQVMTTGRIKAKSNQYRDFVAMSDVVRAVEHFLFVIPGQWKNEIFNVGSGVCISVADVAERVSRVYKRYYQKECVPIEWEEEDKAALSDSFHFSVRKLKATRFELEDPKEEEIFSTLRLCETVKEGQQGGL